MSTHPFSTPDRQIPFVNALAQCVKCKQVSSYDDLDAYDRRPLECRCGGRLKLYAQVPYGPTP